MAGTQELVLGDKNISPDEELIFSILGDKKIVWQKIIAYTHENYKDVEEVWRYYNDGKQWLFRLVHKKKTIFWAGLLKDTFRVTFYFGDKAEPAILSSSLPANIKEDFIKTKRYGQLRGITTLISGVADVENISKLIDIKLKLK